MNSFTSITAAMKGKAPIVAIPVEGHAPVCVDRKRLAAWSKGVEILTVETEPFLPYETFRAAKGERKYCNGVYIQPEGPEERVVTINGGRWLKITGVVGTIKTQCRMIAIDRRVAIKELSIWSEKERIKIKKKVMLGALSKDVKKAMKRAKFEDEGEGMIEVMCAVNDEPAKCLTCGFARVGQNCAGMGHEIQAAKVKPKVARMGIELHMAEMPRLKFAVVKFGEVNEDVSFTVTEIISGKQIGNGGSAEDAILNARQTLAKISKERLDQMQDEILSSQEVAA